MELQLILVIVVLIIGILALEMLHYKERKDLYDRLMSENVTEYIATKEAEKKPKKEEKKRIDPIKASIQQDSERGYLE